MTDFRFDEPPSAQTNRAADVTDCKLCGGDRLVLVDALTETHMRCPECNAAPTNERAPVNVDAWWKQ